MAKKNKHEESPLQEDVDRVEDIKDEPNSTEPIQPSPEQNISSEETPEPATSAEDESEEMSKASYEELEIEILELKDQLLRTVAESENVRRRTERDKADSAKYSITNFARSILTVADNLNRALESVDEKTRLASEELNNLYTGIEITVKELDSVYEKFEITPIDAIGKKFDHNFHQAMFEVEDLEKPHGTVVQQVQKGYMIYDRLLRPAMVGVSKGGDDPGEMSGELGNGPDQTAPEDKNAKASSSAYEKQANAGNQEEDGISQLDKEL